MWGVRLTAAPWTLQALRFTNYGVFPEATAYSLGWQAAWGEVTLEGATWEGVPREARIHLTPNQFSQKIQSKLRLVDTEGAMVGRPGTLLSMVNQHFYKPHCYRVPGWGFLVFCPTKEAQVFTTSSDLPLEAIAPEVEGVVELDTASTAPALQVVHGDTPQDSTFTIFLGAINVTKPITIGYCVPVNASIEARLNGNILDTASVDDFLDVVEFGSFEKVVFYYDTANSIAYFSFAVPQSANVW